MYESDDSDDSGNDGVPVLPSRRPQSRIVFSVDDLTEKEEASRRMRRERNRIAAANCRKRKEELRGSLETEEEELTAENERLERRVSELRRESEQLEFLLASHKQVCQFKAPAPGIGVGASSSSGAWRFVLPAGHRGVSGSNSLVYNAGLSSQGFSSMQLQPVKEEQLQGADSPYMLTDQLDLSDQLDSSGQLDLLDSSGEAASNSYFANNYGRACLFSSPHGRGPAVHSDSGYAADQLTVEYDEAEETEQMRRDIFDGFLL